MSAEYRYLERAFGIRSVDWEMERQSFIETGGRKYDQIEVRLSDGGRRTVFFDITEFFARSAPGTSRV